MFRKRAIGEQALELIEGGLRRGREAVSQAISTGQQAMADYAPSRRRAVYRAGGGADRWVWLAVGAAGGALAMALGRRARGAIPSGRRVEDVMVRDVQTIEASNTLTQAAQRMRDANVGVLPVVEGGRVRGVITDRDVAIRGTARGVDPGSVRVSDYASQDLIAARADWPVEKALETMAEHQIGRLPVVDESDHVVGMVTLSSLALRAPRGADALGTAKEVSRRSARAV